MGRKMVQRGIPSMGRRETRRALIYAGERDFLSI